jgi:hypothetical protein
MSSQRKSLAERLTNVQVVRAREAQTNLEKKIKNKKITTFSVDDLDAATRIILDEYENRELAPRIENESIREAYIAMQTKINKKLNKDRSSSRLSLGRSVAPRFGNQGSSPSRGLSTVRETTAVGGRKTRRKSRSRKNRKSRRRH